MTHSRPQRTCIGCGRKAGKDALLRFSISVEDGLVLDIIQRHEGRGTYLCPQKRCFQQAVKKRRLHNRLPKDMIPDLGEWIAYVQEHLLHFIGKAMKGADTTCDGESRGVCTRQIIQARQNLILLSSEGVVNNDQN